MCYAPHPLRLRSTPSPRGGLFSPNYRLKVVLAAWCRRTATNEGRNIFSLQFFKQRAYLAFRCPLAFPFFAFSPEREKREKTYGSGNPCRGAAKAIPASRVARNCYLLAFPFGESGANLLSSCFPLWGEWREAPREDYVRERIK